MGVNTKMWEVVGYIALFAVTISPFIGFFVNWYFEPEAQ